MPYTPPTPPTSNADPWLPSTAGPGGAAIPAGVYRVNRSGAGVVTSLEALGNVECVAITVRLGAHPGEAHFRYRWGSGISGAPGDAEQALSTLVAAGTGTPVIAEGDEVAVRMTRPDSTLVWFFNGPVVGFGLEMEGDAAGGVEDVRFTALGIAHRCRDAVIPGQLMRKTTTPATAGADVATDIVAHFNPAGRPNCTASGANTGTAPNDYPVFLDPAFQNGGTVIGGSGPQRFWTLANAARWLLASVNAAQKYVKNPTGTTLDGVLVARESNGTGYDPNDVATYTPRPILVPDKPATGKDWPSVLEDLVGGRAIGMAWRLSSDGSGYPTTALDLFAMQSGPIKDLWLQARGSSFDPTLTNLGSARLARDLAGVANSWTVKGAPLLFEASWILAPGFPMAAGDKSAASLPTFVIGNAAYPSNSDKYRLFVLDESGEGHYVAFSATALTTAADLSAVLGAATGAYVQRRRKPLGELFSIDANGRRRRSSLAYSTDYAATPRPGLWDGSGTWHPISSGYALLPDRIGIRITSPNPNAWHAGKDAHAQDAVLKAIDALASADTSNPAFHLRLTCVIEGDRCLKGTTANPTFGTPLPWTVAREVDAADRLAVWSVFGPSEFQAAAGLTTTRDDTEAAKAEAYALKQSTEIGLLEGEARVPYLTGWYQLGDRIRGINGRNLGLRTDSGGTSDPPVYPVVTAIRWDLADGQQTVLTLSDSEGRHPRQAKVRPAPPPAARYPHRDDKYDGSGRGFSLKNGFADDAAKTAMEQKDIREYADLL